MSTADNIISQQDPGAGTIVMRVGSAVIAGEASDSPPRSRQKIGATVDPAQAELDLRAREAVMNSVRFDAAAAALSELKFVGTSQTDCLQQSLRACEQLMTSNPAKQPVTVGLYSNMMEYRDTGAGGHETSARVVLTSGETGEDLTFACPTPTNPDRYANVVVRLSLVPTTPPRVATQLPTDS